MAQGKQIKTPKIKKIVGGRMRDRFARRAFRLLLEAWVATTHMPSEGPRWVALHVDDVLGAAAARLLCASGLLRQNLDTTQAAETYGHFEITRKGERLAAHLTIPEKK